MIIQGVTLKGTYVVDSLPYVTANLVLNLDAGLSSSFSGNTTWRDTVNGLSFTLSGSPTYSSNNGGYINFVPASSQYAYSPNQSFGNLPSWTVETWHYYTGTNTGGSPCILTEVFTGGGINYTLGAINNSGTDLEAGWFNGGQWIYTGTSYNLTPGNWYQIVGTYDGTFPKLYVNNTLVATGITSGGPAFGSGQGIRLMRRWDNADYWGGNLAIVKIYSGDIGYRGVASSWNTTKSRFGL